MNLPIESFVLELEKKIFELKIRIVKLEVQIEKLERVSHPRSMSEIIYGPYKMPQPKLERIDKSLIKPIKKIGDL